MENHSVCLTQPWKNAAFLGKYDNCTTSWLLMMWYLFNFICVRGRLCQILRVWFYYVSNALAVAWFDVLMYELNWSYIGGAALRFWQLLWKRIAVCTAIMPHNVTPSKWSECWIRSKNYALTARPKIHFWIKLAKFIHPLCEIG